MVFLILKYINKDEYINIDTEYEYNVNDFKKLIKMNENTELIFGNNKGIKKILNNCNELKIILNELINNNDLDIIKFNEISFKTQIEDINKSKTVSSLNSDDKNIIENFELIDSFSEDNSETKLNNFNIKNKFFYETFDTENKNEIQIRCFYCKLLIKNINFYLCNNCNFNKCYLCNERFKDHPHKLKLINRKDNIDYYNHILLDSERLIEKFSIIIDQSIILNFKDILNFRNLVKVFGENNWKLISKIFNEHRNKNIIEIQNLLEVLIK